MSDGEDELDCAQEGVLLRPLELATIVVSGSERISWLNGLVTCDLSKKAPGDAAYGLKVQKTGKIEAELWILLGADDVLVGVRRDKAAELVEVFERHLVMEDAEVELDDIGRSWWIAIGQRAAEAADAARAVGARTGTTLRGGLPTAVIAAQGEGDSVRERVLASCEPALLATEAGWTRVRVEHGIPEWGIDFDDKNFPQEASLEMDAVSFTKGCYLGQEVVFMLEKRGHVKKRLVQLVLEGDTELGATIESLEGEPQGQVTSLANRPARSLALGWVKYKQAADDTELRVLGVTARVTALLAVRPG
jgi:tRNA-modifying protein YgfZ